MDYNTPYSTYPQYSQPSLLDNPFFVIFILIFAVLTIASYWKIFQKAGKPGWAAIIPIYNIWVMLEVVKKPTWWIILFIVPIVNVVITLLVGIALAKRFGKDAAFGVFLNWLLHPVGQLILGFGKATYKK